MFHSTDQLMSIITLSNDEGKDFLDRVRDYCLSFVADLVNSVLLKEALDYCGAGYGERCPDKRWDSLNGSYPRTLTIFDTLVEIRMPRTRKPGFTSSLIEAYQRRSAQTDQAIIDTYIGGSSVRETSALIYQLTDCGLSKTAAAEVIRKLDEQRKAFQSRRLDDDHLYLCLDGMHVRCMVAPPAKVAGARNGESIEKVTVLLVRGIRRDGTRETIDFRVAPGETERAWETFLQDLYRRGLHGENLRLAVHDGSTGLESALASVYGTDFLTQRCVCHKIANVLDAAATNDILTLEALRSDVSEIYQAASKRQAYRRLEEFIATWQDTEPKAVSTLRNGFEKTLSFLHMPAEHRRWIITNNPIEREIREIRRRTDQMNTFMGLEHLNRAVYIAIYKTSDERRSSIPYKLWADQGDADRPRRKVHPKANISRRKKEFLNETIAGLGAPL